MTEEDSVARMIAEIKAGNDHAAEQLWERYFPQLVEIARGKLASQRDPMIDGEDVALSVMESFFTAARDDHFPELNDRNGLWRLLSKMTYRKAIDTIRYNSRDRRRGAHESDLGIAITGSGVMQHPMNQVPGDDDEPPGHAIVQESIEQLLDLLDSRQRKIALLKLEGYTNQEIADQIDRAVPTVELALRIIRKKWKDYRPPSR